MTIKWWVVTLVVAGQERHYARSPLPIEDNARGRWLRVGAGLGGGEVAVSAPWLGQTPEERTTDLSILDPGLDMATLHAQGHTLDGIPAEVALWTEGTDWQDREILLSGQVTGYRWGTPEEATEISAAASVSQDRGLIPPPEAAVNAATWPYASENATGLYPYVLGAPGSDGVRAVPCLFVESIAQGGARDLLLIAGHPVSAASVLVFDGSSSESLLVEQVADGAGRLVSVVDLSTATVIANDEALDYYCAFNDGAGGLLSITGTNAATGAGSVLEAVLALSTLPIDRSSLASVRDALNAYKMGAVVTEAISPADWVVDGAVPFLPVALTTGPKGWRFTPVLLDAAYPDCAGTLTARRPNVVRQGLVEQEGRDEIANTLELRYSIDLDASESAQTAQVTGGTTHPTLPAVLSRQIYGERVKSEETVWVYDAPTAYRILLHWARAYAFPRSVLTYRCLGCEWVRPGTYIWLVDAELQIERAAWVQSATYNEAGYQVVQVVLWRADAK